MALHIPGLIMMVVFYVLVLGIGIWASFKSRKMEKNELGGRMEVSFLANRSVGMAVGVFTMAATWVGSGFIISVAETVYDPTQGLIWALLPLQMSISFIIGGLFFAKPMRDKNYITMMDPFQEKYGKTLTGLLAVIPFISDVLWAPITLRSLGVTVSVFADLPLSLCVWISAAVAIIYTVLGGLYSVVFTDVIQLSLMFGGLWLSTPFVLVSDVFTDISHTAWNHTHQAPWLGHLQPEEVWTWVDNFLALSVGNMASQTFHQRTLSSSSTHTARVICFAAAGVVLLLGIPPVLIGAVAASTDWNLTSYGSPSPYERGESVMALPLILMHLTPTAVSVVGMGAIAAAAMSSTDSSFLSATTIFTSNIYKVIRNQASDRELQWVIRCTIVVVGIVGSSLTYLDSSILGIWLLSSDLTYTIMLPQLICILFVRVSNSYGAITGFIVALVMRVLCGEPVFNIPVTLHFPGCTLEDGVYVQRSPVKTICMLSSLVSILLFSYMAWFLFSKGILPQRWDVFGVKVQGAATPQEGTRDDDGAGTEENPKSATQPMLESTF